MHHDDPGICAEMKTATACPLCQGDSRSFFTGRNGSYLKCGQCSAVFLHPACYLSKEEEKQRYQEHRNDVDDPGYQKFVEPIVARVRTAFRPEHAGLDFGAGTGPVITKLLKVDGYRMQIYDPFFWDDPQALDRTYDFIVCCEVMEHFHFPLKEFRLLRSLLNSGGSLFCMTELYVDAIDFPEWYYKNDPTHVFFYHPDTLERVRTLAHFASVEYEGRLVHFSA